MPEKYGDDAHEECRRLYCKYGGENHAAIERDMRKKYPSWKRSNLYDRPATKNRGPQLGWINAYGFDNSLKLYGQTLVTAVANEEQAFYLEVKDFKDRARVKALKPDAPAADVYVYRDFCKMTLEARKNLNLDRDNFETFAAGYELLMKWAPDIDPSLTKLLVKHHDRFVELAQAHYGKAEADRDGTGDRANEAGEGPGQTPDHD